MQIDVFTEPATGGQAMQELDMILAGHRVLGVEKHLAVSGPAGPVSFLCGVSAGNESGGKDGKLQRSNPAGNEGGLPGAASPRKLSAGAKPSEEGSLTVHCPISELSSLARLLNL